MENVKHIISVVTVCYNSEKTIERTLNSLISQSDNDFEYVIIDGGSNDRTLDIIKKYEHKFKYGIQLISEPDTGIYNAMNKGIKLSSGRYVALLNSDDWYENNTIEIVKKEIINNKKNIDIYYGIIRLIKDDKEYMIRRNNYHFIKEGNGLIQHPTAFVSKEAYIREGYYDESYRVCADQDFMLKLILGGGSYKAIDSVLTNFSMDGVSYNVDTFNEQMKIYEKYSILDKKKIAIKKINKKISNLVKIFSFLK